MAGKRITFAFNPATQADIDLIDSYLPAPHSDGSPILPGELPNSLPGYLIHLISEMRVDGQVVATGGNFVMGQELSSTMGVWSPQAGWKSADNNPVAGEVVSIGIDAAGISKSQLSRLQGDLNATNQKIMNKTGTVTHEELVANILHGTNLNYFAMLDGSAVFADIADEVVSCRLPSFGTFSKVMKTSYWFGLPRSVKSGGLVMDMDHLTYAVASKDGD